MPITLDIKVPEVIKSAFSDAAQVAIRNDQQGTARRALLWWAWANSAMWVSARPRYAMQDLDAMLEIHPQLRRVKSEITFKSPRELQYDAPQHVVVEKSDDLDDIAPWLSARGVNFVRLLEPCVELVRTNRCLLDGLTVNDMRSMLAAVRADEPCKYSEFELVDALTEASFYDFVKEYWSVVVPERYHDNWHIEYLANELQIMADRVFKELPKLYDLIINIAPGSTKSLLVSVFYPAWIWKRMPSARFIGASYAQNIAMDLSRKTKDVILSKQYQRARPLKLREDQHGKSFFMNDFGGMRLAVGQGGIAGFHAHFIGIDDPLDPNKFSSDTEIKACNDWIKTNLEQRKVSQEITPTILVMQRIAQGDPTQDKLDRAKFTGGVRHICLPAEDREWVQPIELRSRYIDGLMDPVRLPQKVLEEKRQLGDFIYSGQYLQRPTPQGGAQFKIDRLELIDLPQDVSIYEWIKRYKQWRRIVRYWDKAASDGCGCYTVGVLMGEELNGHIWILNVVRGRWDTGVRETRIKQTAMLDGYDVLIAMEQEGGSGGKDSIWSSVRLLKGFAVEADKPEANKILRADAFSTWVNFGNVSVINAKWTQEYLDELEFFPGSTFKDQVDASSGAYKILTKKRREIRVAK